jgi:hypothetical protein
MRDLSQTLNPTQTKTFYKFTAFQVNLGLLLTVIVFGLVYLFTINSLATAGMQIKQLNAKISQLDEDHKKLELEASSLQSVSNLQQVTSNQNFVPSTTVSYIKDDNFALR